MSGSTVRRGGSEAGAGRRRDAPEIPEALYRRSDARGLIQLVSHLGLAALTGSLVFLSSGTPWQLAGLFVHGVVVVFLFAPLHECIHRTAFSSRRLNDLVAWCCGFLLALPPGYFRAFHLAHHRHTQVPGRDPELAVPKPATWWHYVAHVSGIPLWRERVATLTRHALGRVEEDFVADAARAAITAEARVFVGLYAGAAIAQAALGDATLLRYWVVPVLLGQPVLRCFLLAEHAGCPLVTDMLRNSRTTLCNPLLRMLSWNMPFHAEHHFRAAIPFHALPRAHAILAPHLGVEARGYPAVHAALVRSLGGGRRYPGNA